MMRASRKRSVSVRIGSMAPDDPTRRLKIDRNRRPIERRCLSAHLGATQVGEGGQDAPVRGGSRVESKLAEDVGHVLLDGGVGDEQALGDAVIRLPLGK